VHFLPLVESDTPPVCGTLYFMELKIKSKIYGEHIVHFDDEDFYLIKDIKWNISVGDDQVFYARGRVRKRNRKEGDQIYVRMHRLIMNVSNDVQVDHINHNGLDNRRNNLRVATQKQNGANRRMDRDNWTGFKGVTLRKKKGLYCPRIRVNGELIHGRLTKNIYDAALQYNEMAIKYFGEFACINELTENQKEQAKVKIPAKRVLSSNTTGYRGICVGEGSKKNPYIATIRVDGKNKYLGCFATAKKAAIAYNDAVILYNKPSGWLNKIPNE
jgi:HNH endonuclease